MLEIRLQKQGPFAFEFSGPHLFASYFLRRSCLESRIVGTSVDAQKLDVNLSKVMLTKFPWKTFEADQRFDSFGAQGAHQGIQRRFTSRVARFSNPSKDFQRG